MSFDAVIVTRRTAETEFEIVLAPRTTRTGSLPLPNRLLSHFVDHLSKAGGFNVESVGTKWPGSWRFDHVLCEDLGQLIGRGIAAIHDQRALAVGVPGRAAATCCMDDAEVEVSLGIEGRPSTAWSVPGGADIDGFVDAWYADDDRLEGWASGTNLRQFLDGFAIGAGAGLSVTVRRAGNLHHVYETIFRALGDALGSALGIAGSHLPGDSSGLAGGCEYTVRKAER